MKGQGNIRDQHRLIPKVLLTSPKSPFSSSSVKCWWKAGSLWAVTPISTKHLSSPRERL